MKTENFIKKAMLVHDIKYDYSKVEYINNRTKVCIICSEHGEFWQTPKNHLKKQGCPICGKEYAKIVNVKPIDQVILDIKNIQGDKYDYSKMVYINNKTKIDLICKECGNNFKIRVNDLLGGHGCPNCLKIKNIKSIEELKISFNTIHNGKYDYSKVETNDIEQHITIICPIHGDFKQKIKNHLNGNGCQKCATENFNNSRKKSIDYYLQKIGGVNLNNFIIGINEFENSQTKITFTCKKCGHKFMRSISNFLINPSCPECNKIHFNKCKTNSDFINDAKKIFGDEYDYSLTNYIKSDEKVDIICPEHGVFSIEANSHLQGHGCPLHYCNKSKKEEELYEFIKSLLPNEKIIKNDKSLLNGKELDIYIPSLNIAFEFDGLYWHNELNKDKNYHLDKSNKCKDVGVRLFHIFEDEWIFKKNIIKSMVKNLFKQNKNIIFARKCELREVSPHEASLFLDENHLQGKCPSSIKLGLYFNGELVSLMTFGNSRHFIGNNKHEYELLRFCNKINTSVIGGASKIFKYFLNEYSPNNIVSYADKRWSEGDLYFKLNFVKYNESKPNYFYVINNKRVYRFNLRKSVLINKYGCSKSMTEREFCLSKKWYRIYDCGCLCFKWKK